MMPDSVWTGGRAESTWLPGLHLATLASLAEIWPAYLFLGKQELWIAHHDSSRLLVVILLLSALLPAVALTGLLALRTLSPRAAGASARFLVGCLGGLAALQLLRACWPAPGPLLLTEAVGCGFALSWCYRDLASTRRILTILSPLILIVPLSVLLATQTEHTALDENPARPLPRVVMVLVREWPLLALLEDDTKIDSELFPNLASLVENADWFPAATAVASTPDLSSRGLWEGRYPESEASAGSLLATLSRTYDLRLYEQARQPLGDTDESPGWLPGFFLQMFLPADVITPLAGLVEVERRVTEIGSSPTPPAKDYASGLTLACERFRHFIQSIQPTSRPVADLIEVNFPGPLRPEFKQRLVEQVQAAWEDKARVEAMPRSSQQEPWLREEILRHYSLQSSLLDALLGELVSHLKRTGLYDSTLLLVASDLGALVPSPRALLSVPFFLKRPHQKEGHINTRNVETIDILPTVLDLLGFGEEATGKRGISAFGTTAPRPRKMIFSKRGTYSSIDAGFFTRGVAQAGLSGAQFRLPGATGLEADLSGHPIDKERVEPVHPENPFIRLSRHRFLQERDDSVLYRVPSLVVGEFQSGEESFADDRLAIAVNDVIREAPHIGLLPEGGQVFSALVEDLSPTEAQRVDIFSIRTREGHATLRNVRQIWPPRMLLREAGGKEVVLLEDGRRAEVRNDRIQGWVVGGKSREGEPCFVGGWAVDRTRPALVEMVATFLNDGMISSGATDMERPEAVEMFSDPDLLLSGFRQTFSLPPNLPLEKAHIRVLALSGTAAGELHYPESSDNWPFSPAPGRTRGPSYRWGDQLIFGENGSAAPYLGGGWGGASEGVSWTVDRVASLHLSTGRTSEKIILEAFFKPFLAPPHLNSQRIELFLDEEPLGAWTVTRDQFELHRLEIPPDRFPSGGSFSLRFVTPDSRSPAAVGSGPDERVLGLAMAWIRLTPAPQP